ncbi:hypothetical protein ACGFZ7_05320 [Pseudomonas sp. NPDC047963]|nr:hypothetical protein [Pseudomonas sp.]
MIVNPQGKSFFLGYLISKVNENRFFLEMVVDGCDDGERNYRKGLTSNEAPYNQVVYGFSALGNTIQSIKDCSNEMLLSKITWGDIKNLKCGRFMYGARNAMTHDGNPVVNCCINGKCYAGLDIERIYDGKIIKIERPSEDIKHVCLSFVKEFSNLLLKRFSDAFKEVKIRGELNIDMIEQALHHPMSRGLDSIVLDQLKAELLAQKDVIEEKVGQTKMDELIKILHSLKGYCEDRLTA